ncbi:Non-reducing polyketide synthase ausA [Lasiodiplodia theobromae]|uniref:Non-reducing polyketide synthase ausA n=1 Tax=Lasiodiplodia theobromae TaxID=45133 RepID=A0A5N5DQP5_9PEZI|nr:Non-reducing polyketide synthase ausA [Lasiodiplodia theobromae]
MPTLTLHYKEDPSAGPIPAEIHYSSTTTTAPKPIILIFHAGGFAAGSTALIPRTQIKYLTETLDTIVVAPAYRLCPQVSLREGPLADARDCLAWARTELAAALRREGVPVVADAERIGVMGHSAGGMLALELGNEPHPPAAILDFYGIKYLTDPFWTAPLAAFAAVPDAPAALRKQVFDGPVPVASPPMFVNGKPDLRSPRSAWMIHALKHGTWFRACVEGGDAVGDGEEEGLISEETLTALEPTRGFGRAAGFPPTCFVHGTEDVFAPFALAERAEREAKAKGVEVKFVRVQGAGHVFDIGLAEEDELFKGPVVTALKWFVERIGRSQG